MANGQIPQALQYFTQYLQQENARLEQEEKERNINTAISQTVTKFKDLGPDATQEDARELLFESIRVAANTDAPETIPFIQGVYSDAANYIERNKVLRQSERLGQLVKEQFGIDPEELSGEQALQYIQTLKSLTTPIGITEKTGEGEYTSFIQPYEYKMGPEGLGHYPSPQKIQTGVVDYKEMAKLQATYGSGGNLSNLQLPALETLNTETGERFPIIFDPEARTGSPFSKVVNGQRVALTPDEEKNIDSRIEEGLRFKRGFDVAKATQEQVYKSAEEYGKGLAASILYYGDPSDELRRVLRNLETRALTPEAYNQIKSMFEAGVIQEAVIGIKDPTQKAVAVEQLKGLSTLLVSDKAAEESLLTMTGIKESDIKGITIREYKTLTTDMETALQNPTLYPQEFKTAQKAYDVFMMRGTGLTPNKVLNYELWQTLDPKIKAAIISEIKRKKGKNN